MTYPVTQDEDMHLELNALRYRVDLGPWEDQGHADLAHITGLMSGPGEGQA